MTSLRRRSILVGGLALPAVSAVAGFAGAQAPFPMRPIRLLVGGAAGSVPDTLARVVAERLAPGLGQPVLVENRPGAAGIVAMQALVGSEPDGHTLALATMSQAVFNSYLFSRLPYDPLRDFEPIIPLASAAFTLAAHPGFAADTLAGLVVMARANPGSVFLGAPANGSPPHIAALMLVRAAGIKVSFVPFTSGPDGLRAVLRGDVPLFLDGPTIVSQQARAGMLKALVVTGRAREPELPGVPTVAEAGLPEATCEAWIGLVAPAGIPPALVARLNREISAVLAAAELRERLRALSFVTAPASSEEFRRLILEEHRRWGPAIRDAGLKLD